LIRIRFTHTKSGALRYTGNLDMQKVWERAFRRAKLPLAYSQGFHPQPRINQACPLPLGFTSQAELLDVWLKDDMPLDEIRSSVEAAIPGGIAIDDIAEVDLRTPALQTQVDTSEYVVTLHQEIDPTELQTRVNALLSASSLPRERRGKTYDLRPLIVSMQVIPQPGAVLQLLLCLTVREGATGRPEEVMLALGLDPFAAAVERTRLTLKSQPQTTT
jgi:radical SAM-linked protein